MAFATSNQKWSHGEDVIVFRRVCDSNSKILLAHARKNFNWCSLYQTESCDDMLAYFMDTLNAMLDYYMPQKLCIGSLSIQTPCSSDSSLQRRT